LAGEKGLGVWFPPRGGGVRILVQHRKSNAWADLPLKKKKKRSLIEVVVLSLGHGVEWSDPLSMRPGPQTTQLRPCHTLTLCWAGPGWCTSLNSFCFPAVLKMPTPSGFVRNNMLSTGNVLRVPQKELKSPNFPFIMDQAKAPVLPRFLNRAEVVSIILSIRLRMRMRMMMRMMMID
jgi:hypothetical protein